MNRRAEILQELVRFNSPTQLLKRELASFGWDWDGEPLLIITKEDVLRVMDRFLSGEISAEQLQEWAENLELREDVEFHERERELVDPIFFRIATPEINEPLTPDSVRRMKSELTEIGG